MQRGRLASHAGPSPKSKASDPSAEPTRRLKGSGWVSAVASLCQPELIEGDRYVADAPVQSSREAICRTADAEPDPIKDQAAPPPLTLGRQRAGLSGSGEFARRDFNQVGV